MAALDQADPRWLVADRGLEGQNVNNWHWTERDRTDMAKALLEQLFCSASLDGQGCIVLGGVFEHFDGTVLLFNRKGKSGIVYNIEVRLSWTANLGSGARGNGTMLVHEISEEALEDGIEMEFTMADGMQDVYDAVKRAAAETVPVLAAQFVSEMQAVLQNEIQPPPAGDAAVAARQQEAAAVAAKKPRRQTRQQWAEAAASRGGGSDGTVMDNPLAAASSCGPPKIEPSRPPPAAPLDPPPARNSPVTTGQQPAESAVVPIGTVVGVGGLVGAAQHNGKLGTVTAGPDPTTGRYTVRLHAGGNGGTPLGVKLANLRLLPPRPPPSAGQDIEAGADGERSGDADGWPGYGRCVSVGLLASIVLLNNARHLAVLRPRVFLLFGPDRLPVSGSSVGAGIFHGLVVMLVVGLVVVALVGAPKQEAAARAARDRPAELSGLAVFWTAVCGLVAVLLTVWAANAIAVSLDRERIFFSLHTKMEWSAGSQE